jgi:O-methyltransferase
MKKIVLFLRYSKLYHITKIIFSSIASKIVKLYILRYIPSKNILLGNKNAFDPIRAASISLAINRLKNDKISGSFAEVGVFKGYTSSLIHSLDSSRKFYLFDTFEGFPDKDIGDEKDKRFNDTSIDLVKKNIGYLDNIEFRKGYFPETAIGLDQETFSFVMLDADLYNPTLAGLKFFYPRVNSGGYIFIHDYNSPESDWAVSKAVNIFMKDKSEKIVEIPDMCGSIIIRKI